MSGRPVKRKGDTNSALVHQINAGLVAHAADDDAHHDLPPEDIEFDFFGYDGFVSVSNFCHCQRVNFNDVNAFIAGSCYVEIGGSFKLMIVHRGQENMAGKTAGGNLSMTYDVAEGTRTWNVNSVVFDLPLGNLQIVNYDTYAVAQTIANDSTVGFRWNKDDNADGATTFLMIDNVVLVRQ